MGGDGQIVSYAVGKDSRQNYVKKQLEELRDLCLKTNQSFPEHISFDDCCQNRKVVKAVFSKLNRELIPGETLTPMGKKRKAYNDNNDNNAETEGDDVVKIFRGIPHCNCDIKHIVNRMVENLRKSSPLYRELSKALHGAVVGKEEIVVRSRSGEAYKLNSPLKSAIIE